MFLHPASNETLIQRVLDRKHSIENSIHGLGHWQKVERNGLFLQSREGGDQKVISLFSLFHDSQRLNDFEDPEHGKRGGLLALEFYKAGLLPLTNEQFNLLIHACDHHTDLVHHEDITVQCCWDADRLDLTRIGVLPDPELLNTNSAKQIAETMDYSAIENFLLEQ